MSAVPEATTCGTAHIIDSTVPLSYHRAMLDSWPEKEVRTVMRYWEPPGGHRWIVEFELANLGGRIECVGVAVRSSVDTSPMPYDWRASLRPLNAITLRKLPFDGLLTLARRDQASLLRRGWLIPENDPETWQWAEELAADYESPGKSGGHRSKYSPGFLARVASVYQAAFARGESSPSQFVERELKLTPDVARKLVHRCREPHLRLLPPAEPRKARGWRPGERDDTQEPEGPSR